MNLAHLSFDLMSDHSCCQLAWWHGELVVGRRTCNRKVVASNPAGNLGQVVHTPLPRLGAFSMMNLSRSPAETTELDFTVVTLQVLSIQPLMSVNNRFRWLYSINS